MLKLGIEIKQSVSKPDGKTDLNIKLVDPTKKQLEEATDNEKLVAQKFKDLFDSKLIYLLSEPKNEEDL